MESNIQQGLIWVLSGLTAIVSYFLRLFHKEVKSDIVTLKEENKKLSIELGILKSKQTDIEKSIEREIKHIREIIDTKLDSIEEGLGKLLKNHNNKSE